MSESDEVRYNAMMALVTLVNESFGAEAAAEAAALAAELRAANGVECLVHLLDDPSADMQQCSMSVLGNLQISRASCHIPVFGGMRPYEVRLCRVYAHAQPDNQLRVLLTRVQWGWPWIRPQAVSHFGSHAASRVRSCAHRATSLCLVG